MKYFQTRIHNESIDIENRTVVIEFSHGTKGKRRSFMGDFFEELVISDDAIDMRRLNSGAPFLAVHNAFDLDAVIGVVEEASVEGDIAIAKIRFAKDEISERVFQKVVDGILKNVSVGYDIHEFQELHDDKDKIPTIRVTKWEPVELSLVPIGFDREAQIRSRENLNNQNNLTNQMENNTMKKELLIKLAVERSLGSEKELKAMDVDQLQKMVDQDIETRKQVVSTPEPTTIDQTQLKDDSDKRIKEAVIAERTRCTQIRSMVKEAGLKDEIADSYIQNSQTVDQARYNVDLFKKHKQYNDDNQVTPTSPANEVLVSAENQEARRDGIIEAVLHSSDSTNFQLTDKGKEFAGQSLLRMLESHCGRKNHESNIDFVQRVMSSSDLPAILSNVAQKTAQKRYELAPKTFEAWTNKGTLNDFKESTQLRGGDIGALQPINEAGEYEQSSIGEESEKAQLRKYGVMHSFSDIMLINDDLDMILEIAREAGVAQARLDNQLAYDALTDNPVMNDTFNVFSSDHANLGTPGAIGETTFDEAFQLMRKQQGIDKRDFLNLAPSLLVTGPDQETAAKKFLAIIQPAQSTDVNVFSNSVQLIVDAVLLGNQYYFIANPVLIDTVKVNRLKGQESVRVASRTNWRNDAIELKLTYAVQAKALEFRGMVKNAGQ